MPHERGFFYHFVDGRTGERAWKCELSSIDSSILLCGVLTCGQHFDDPEIRRLQAQTEHVFGLEMAKVRRMRVLSFLQGVALSLLRHSILFTLLWLIFHDVLTTGEPGPWSRQALSRADLSQLWKKDPDAALTALRQRWLDEALAIAPTSPQVHASAGYYYRATGQNFLSLASFANAITYAPLDAEFYAELGQTYELIGSSANAAFWYGQAALIAPDEPRYRRMQDAVLGAVVTAAP